ncbi:MAG: YihY/virulence factor BrkB family protein, partial [Paracoccaceae bacterium]
MTAIVSRLQACGRAGMVEPKAGGNMQHSTTRHFIRSLLRAMIRFREKRGWIMSSHVAMSMLLALFPFLLFVVALAGAVTADVQTEALIDLVLGSWPKEIGEPIAREVRAVTSGAGSSLLTIGAVLAVYFASNGVDALRAAMTRAYHGSDPRPWWQQRLLCLVFVLCGAGALVAAVFVGIAAPLYLHFMEDAAPRLYTAIFGNEVMRQIVTALVLVVAVTACHLWLPAKDVRPAHVWPGILLTLFFWALAGYG